MSDKAKWSSRAKQLLQGIFANTQHIDDPITIIGNESKIAYPNKSSSQFKLYEYKMETLARSFLIAAPVMVNEQDYSVNGICLKDYYKQWILNSCSKGCDEYLMNREDLSELRYNEERVKLFIKGVLHRKKISKNDFVFQHIVECAQLALGLYHTKAFIWDSYTDSEKNTICDFFNSFASGPTHEHNWQCFNALILSFLHSVGYPIDQSRIKQHLQNIVNLHVGDGWYSDRGRFDYYTAWIYNFLGPLVNELYANQYEKELALQIDQNANLFINNFVHFFDDESRIIMWGRSSSYRNAITVPLIYNSIQKNRAIEPEKANQISFQAMEHFFENENMLTNGLPSLGYYRAFDEIIQPYSCPASPLMLGWIFCALLIDDDHRFWDASNEGISSDSECLKETQITNVEGPGISLWRYPESGTVELKVSKVNTTKTKLYTRHYSRLAFSSLFPYEIDGEDFATMQYVVKGSKLYHPNIIDAFDHSDGIFRREFKYQYRFLESKSIKAQEVPVKYGTLRVDNYKGKVNDRVTLSSYGMPEFEDNIIVSKVEKQDAEAHILDNGKYQLAFILYYGFEETRVEQRKGTNPISEKSSVIVAKLATHCGDPVIAISSILVKKSGEKFTESELFQVSSYKIYQDHVELQWNSSGATVFNI
ncbi:DUF2264 domain-containing protein [Vibrio sp. WJH972]